MKHLKTKNELLETKKLESDVPDVPDKKVIQTIIVGVIDLQKSLRVKYNLSIIFGYDIMNNDKEENLRTFIKLDGRNILYGIINSYLAIEWFKTEYHAKKFLITRYENMTSHGIDGIKAIQDSTVELKIPRKPITHIPTQFQLTKDL